MIITEIIEAINNSTYDERQSLIKALYAQDVLVPINEFDNKVLRVKNLLFKNNLKVPKKFNQDEINKVMIEFLFEDVKSEYQNSIIDVDFDRYLDIVTYYLVNN